MSETGEAGRDGRLDNPSRVRATVLVLDDDPRLLSRLRTLLQRHGFAVVCAQTSRAACDAVASRPIGVALVDYRLRGKTDGLSVGASLRREHSIPFVVMSGYLHTDLTVLAMRLGAFDVIDKPLPEDRLVGALNGALVPASETATTDYLKRYLSADKDEESVSSRWVDLMLRGCAAPRDLKTVAAVGRAANVSAPVFRSACYLCGVKPAAARLLCRFLRALARSLQDRSTVLSHLHFGDRRTAERAFSLAGLGLAARRVPLQGFLRHQKIVSTDLDCLRELAHRAANSPLFMTDEWDE